MASDSRDWVRYSEGLVRRGEVLLDFSVVDGWRGELERMNDGKVGEPYHYPESFIRLFFHLPYRQCEGFVRALAKYVDLEAPDYSTINRRVNRLDLSLKETLVKSRGPVSVAVDASGVKVHNGGLGEEGPRGRSVRLEKKTSSQRATSSL